MVAALNSSSGRKVLDSFPLTIGSSQDNSLVVDNINVSAHHTEIRPEGDGYSITDLGSAHGTFVNGQQLDWNTPRLLSPGDAIGIGDTTFTYEVGEVSTSASGDNPSDRDAPVFAHHENRSDPLLSPTNMPPSPSAYGMGVPLDLSQQSATHTLNTARTVSSDPSIPVTDASSSSQENLVHAAQVPYMFPQAYYAPGTLPPGYPNQMSLTPVPPGYPAIYPPGYSGPIPGYVPISAQPQRKRLKRLWLWLSVAVVVLLIASAVTFFLITRSTPEKTLDAYCNALQGGDYQSAYNQLSSSLQNLETEPLFARTVTDGLGRVTSCTHSGANTTSNVATATMNFAVGAGQSINGIISLTQDSNNTWKINVLLSTPTLTLRTFCNALQSGDVDVAYDQLSSDLRSVNSEAVFAVNFSGSTCTFASVTEAGASATSTLTFRSPSGSVITHAQLAQDSNSNNEWKISGITR